MKNAMIFALILVLALSLLAGCRDTASGGSGSTDSNSDSRMMPDGDNGMATDGDGMIGDGIMDGSAGRNSQQRSAHY